MTPDQLRQICPRCKDVEAVSASINSAVEKWGVTDIPMFVAQLAHESGEFRWTAELASGAAYEGRRDLGNTEPGDGVRFKGRGYIQVTGRENYRRCGAALGLDLLTHPELLQELPYAADCAGWYWNWRRLNGLNLVDCTRRINGGLNGLPIRRAYYEKACATLAAAPETQPLAPVEDHSPTTEPVKENPMAIPALVPIALEAISTIVPAVTGLMNDKTKTVPERNTAAAMKIVDVARESIGAVNEQQMIEKIQAEPASAATVKQAVQGAWFEIVEGGGGGIAGAREADRAFISSGAKPWQSPAFIVTLLLLLMPFGLLSDVFYVHPESYDGTLRVQVVTAVLAIIMIVSGYWIGTSASSARKTEMLGDGK